MPIATLARQIRNWRLAALDVFREAQPYGLTVANLKTAKPKIRL